MGSTISFNPTDGCGGGTVGCFSFSAGNNTETTSGSASGLVGSIAGTYGVGTIGTVATVPFLVESASVSGSGTLTIIDGIYTLTADLVWVDIFSAGTAGGANISGTANLTNIQYDDGFSNIGTNADLLALFNGGSGVQTLTYQFGSPMSLTQLFTSGATTSFSGNITPIPVPAAVWLFGSGLLGLVGVARRKSV